MNPSKQAKTRDIAEAAGVSTATVSRVFSRHPYVSEEIRQKVLEIARKLHYAPTITSSRYLIGVMMRSIDEGILFNPYHNQLLHHVSQELFRRGFNIRIFGENQLPYLHKHSFAGVILTDSTVAEEIRESGIPVLLVNRIIPGMHSIVTDHREGIALAVRHLLENGHRRIGLLRLTDNWGSNERESGFRSALKQMGVEPDSSLIIQYKEADDPVRIVQQLWKFRPTAVIAEGETVGVPLNYAFYRLGIKVPEELSVITFEDPMNSQYMTPPQTTIFQNFAVLGQAVAETIADLCASEFRWPKVPECRVLNCSQLIERKSVRNIRSGVLADKGKS